MSERKSNEIFSDPNVPPALQQHMAAIQELSGQAPAQPVQRQAPIKTTTQAAIKEESIDEMIARDFGIDIPDECIPLPSRGILYPVDHPFYGAETVDIKAMSAKEEDILTSQALIKKGTVISELIRSCLSNKSVNSLDLLVGDRNAIMVGIRVTGYGQIYDGEVVCTSCGDKSSRDFNLAELEVKPLTIQPIQEGVNEFEWITTYNKKPLNIHFRFLTGRDEEEMMVVNEKQKKTLGLAADTNVTSMLQRCIVSVNGVSDRAKLAHLIKRLPAELSSNIRKFIKDNEPGLKMTQESKCPLCNHAEEVAIPIGVKFLWPNAG